MIKEYTLPVEYKLGIEEFYRKTPLFSNSQFFNILALINRELNGETIDIISKFNVFDQGKEKAIGRKHTRELVDIKENERFHNTYLFEKEYYGYIQRGDVEGLKAFFKNAPRITEGKVAGDSLRQAKNIFISSIAIITRKAVEGGLDVETAYLLSDSYIQEAEKMTDSAAITFLNATAAMDFTKRVSEAKIPSGMPIDIYRAIEYISNHVNQDISVEEIADHLGIERRCSGLLSRPQHDGSGISGEHHVGVSCSKIILVAGIHGDGGKVGATAIGTFTEVCEFCSNTHACDCSAIERLVVDGEQ